MNWFMAIPAILQTLIYAAEYAKKGKNPGKKKKEAVVKNASAIISSGVASGALRGSWDQVTPEFLGTLVDGVVGVLNELGEFTKETMTEGLNQA